MPFFKRKKNKQKEMKKAIKKVKPVSKKKTVKRLKKRVEKKEDRTKTSSIEFCKKCGSIMLPDKKGFLKCRACGYQIRKNIKDLKIVEEKEKSDAVIVLEKDQTILPTVDKMCPVCENMRAHYWLQQTRSADEPPTQFFRCTKCKHVWREYK